MRPGTRYRGSQGRAKARGRRNPSFGDQHGPHLLQRSLGGTIQPAQPSDGEALGPELRSQLLPCDRGNPG